MSHTNSTAHYELPQFLGTDKPAWLTDINGAMSAIDTAIYSAQTKANEADAKATQNTSDITTQGGQITTLSGKVSALETAQPVDEAQIELNRQNIATNAQNIVEIDNRLGHVDISAYGSTQTGAIKNIGDKTVNKCVTTDEETIGQPALKAYAVGEFFIGKTDRNLYKVTSAISISDVLAVGANCKVDTIAYNLSTLNGPYFNNFFTATKGTFDWQQAHKIGERLIAYAFRFTTDQVVNSGSEFATIATSAVCNTNGCSNNPGTINVDVIGPNVRNVGPAIPASTTMIVSGIIMV